MPTTISINDKYITLGQLLKLTNVISSGGQVKNFLKTTKVFVNDKFEDHRGKKLHINDIVNINNQIFVIAGKE